jgi:cyclophilin family peptidyl-prolyl cis-trans isomerase
MVLLLCNAPILHLITSLGKHVVFGKVIRGYTEVIERIAQVPVDAKSRPEQPIIISNCGELELRKKDEPPTAGQ